MATYKNCLLGGFRGKLGNIVGSSWNGIPVIRRAPGPRKNPPTILQLQQQERFKLLVQFIRPLKGLLDETFKNSAKRMSCLNKAISENKEIIIGEYPDFRIDYARVVLCKYSASAGYTISVACLGPGILRFAWENIAGTNREGMPNLLFVAAYCGELKRWIYNMFPQVENDGSCHLDLAAFCGYKVQTYVGFKPAFGRPFSSFSGSVDIPKF
jgi:hypothetical protein